MLIRFVSEVTVVDRVDSWRRALMDGMLSAGGGVLLGWWLFKEMREDGETQPDYKLPIMRTLDTIPRSIEVAVIM